jgi:hypothetical protein
MDFFGTFATKRVFRIYPVFIFAILARATSYSQNFNLTSEPITSSFDHGHLSPVTLLCFGNRLHCRLQQRIRFLPSHNPTAIDRDLVAKSCGVSVVLTQDPAQPLATLHSAVTATAMGEPADEVRRLLYRVRGLHNGRQCSMTGQSWTCSGSPL